MNPNEDYEAGSVLSEILRDARAYGHTDTSIDQDLVREYAQAWADTVQEQPHWELDLGPADLVSCVVQTWLDRQEYQRWVDSCLD